MCNQERRRVPEGTPTSTPITALVTRSREEAALPREKLPPVPEKDPQQGEGDDGAHGVVKGGFAHDRLGHAVADPDLLERRHRGGRVGGGERCAEKERPVKGKPRRQKAANPVMTTVIGDPNRGQHHDRDPDMFQHAEAQSRAAVEEDVAGAEQEDDLTERQEIRLDIDRVPRPPARSGMPTMRNTATSGTVDFLSQQTG